MRLHQVAFLPARAFLLSACASPADVKPGDGKRMEDKVLRAIRAVLDGKEIP